MNIFRRMATLFGLETRDRVMSHKDVFLSAADLVDGGGVTPASSESLGAVLACVNATSTAVASLPAWVYRRTQDGRNLDEKHALMRLVRNGCNQYQTWPDWVEWTMAQVLLRGNAVSEIVLDGAGRLAGLMPIPWDNISIQLLPSGRLAYDIVEATSLYGSTGRRRRLLDDEVFHLRDRSDDGIIGRSRLQRAAAVVSAGLSIQQFTSSLYRNGLHPSGVVEAAGKLSADALDRLQTHFKSAFGGTRNAAKAMVLDQGLKWSSISISPEDAELLQSRKFTTEEICRIFQLPPPIVQDYSHNTFTNSEAAGRWFAQFTVGPWCRKLEAEFVRSVFTDSNLEIEFDLSGFMRGDPETRWKSHEIAIRNGILTVDEVREIEGFNPMAESQDVPVKKFA